MKEFLTKNSSGNYQLVNHRFSEDDIEVPGGAHSFRENLRFYNKDGSKFYSSYNFWVNSTTNNTVYGFFKRPIRGD